MIRFPQTLPATRHSVVRMIWTGMLLTLLSACSTLSISDDPSRHISDDPFERFNRKTHAFNLAADKAVLRPTARAYDTLMPDPAQRSVGRFFSNLGEPFNAVNNLLQGKYEGALNSTYRFVVNSTVGIFGLFDVASSYDVERRPEDFGQTLAAWGVKPGPYIVIPLLGPSSVRDSLAGVVGGFGLDVTTQLSDDGAIIGGLYFLNVVNSRANLLGADEVLDRQLDKYLFLKTAYQANRVSAIYDGNPPALDDDDLEF